MFNATPHDIIALISAFEKSASLEMRLSAPGLELRLAKTEDGLRNREFLRQDSLATADRKPAVSSLEFTETASGASSALAAKQGRKNIVSAAPAGHVFVRAANLGTFYRSPKPGAPPYVEIGSRVAADTEVCLIEVMKLFTPLPAGVAGIVCEVMAQDGELVEFDQPLFLVQVES